MNALAVLLWTAIVGGSVLEASDAAGEALPRASAWAKLLRATDIQDAGALAAAMERPERRVRALTPALHRLVLEGTRRSPTFVRVLIALQSSDVIVQIEHAPHLNDQTPARILLAVVAGGFRFVRLQVGCTCVGDDRIAIIGHELFHALEIAGAPEVRDDRTMVALYRRIGFAAGGPYQYETANAQAVGARIRSELATRPR